MSKGCSLVAFGWIILLGCAAVHASVPFEQPQAQLNAFRSLQANPMRNGLVNATLPSKPSIVWTFYEPDQVTFPNSPVVSVEDATAYVTSSSGYIYAVDTGSGKMRWQACVGTAGTFPGDPCKNAGFSEQTPYGDLTLTSSGDVLVLSQFEPHAHPDQLVCVNKTDGSVRWRYSLANSPESMFISLPSSIPQVGGWDAVIVWAAPPDENVVYIVLNSTDGSVITSRTWPTVQQTSPSAHYAPAVFDPMDGTVLGQWNAITEHCDHVDMYSCIGLAKYDTISGAHVWNSSMEENWTNGNFAVDHNSGNVYVSTDQMVGYAYTAKSGQPLWQAQNIATATGDQGWPSVCADGTVIFVDRGGVFYAFNSSIERDKQPIWGVSFAQYTASWGVTTLADNSFVWKEGNMVHATDCASGKPIWQHFFGNTDNIDELSVAASTLGLISVAYAPGKGGILVLLA